MEESHVTQIHIISAGSLNFDGVERRGGKEDMIPYVRFEFF